MSRGLPSYSVLVSLKCGYISAWVPVMYVQGLKLNHLYEYVQLGRRLGSVCIGPCEVHLMHGQINTVCMSPCKILNTPKIVCGLPMDEH